MILHCPPYSTCDMFPSTHHAILFVFTIKSDFVSMMTLNTIPLEFFSSH